MLTVCSYYICGTHNTIDFHKQSKNTVFKASESVSISCRENVPIAVSCCIMSDCSAAVLRPFLRWSRVNDCLIHTYWHPAYNYRFSYVIETPRDITFSIDLFTREEEENGTRFATIPNERCVLIVGGGGITDKAVLTVFFVIMRFRSTLGKVSLVVIYFYLNCSIVSANEYYPRYCTENTVSKTNNSCFRVVPATFLQTVAFCTAKEFTYS